MPKTIANMKTRIKISKPFVYCANKNFPAPVCGGFFLLTLTFILLATFQALAQGDATSAVARLNRVLSANSTDKYCNHQHISIVNGELILVNVDSGSREETKVYLTDLDPSSIGVNNNENPSRMFVRCKANEPRTRTVKMSCLGLYGQPGESREAETESRRANQTTFLFKFVSDSRNEAELKEALTTIVNVGQQNERVSVTEANSVFDDKLGELKGLQSNYRANRAACSKLERRIDARDGDFDDLSERLKNRQNKMNEASSQIDDLLKEAW